MGARGSAGARGDAPGNTLQVVDYLRSEVKDIQRELKTQFTRIAQLQAELDHLRDALGNPTGPNAG